MRREATLVAVCVLCLCVGVGAGCGDDEPGPGPDGGAGDAKADGAKPGDAAADAEDQNDGGDQKEGGTADGAPGEGGTGDSAGDAPPPADLAIADWRPSNLELGVTVDGFTFLFDGSNPNNQPTCGGKIYACSDGQDNDSDGKVDALDPECTGPCDDDEESFATGIPGDNSDACKQDCFFDGDSGSGNDGCDWNLKCDPAGPGANLQPKSCPYDPKYKNCPGPQTQECLDNCRNNTPAGCDCFGCCKIFTDKGEFTVYLGSGSGCSTSTPENCAACTQSQDCVQECGECQLCLGKTIDDLPSKCFVFPPPPPDSGVGSDASPDSTVLFGDGGSTPDSTPPDLGLVVVPLCPNGEQFCLTNSQCPGGYYCLTGCCRLGIL